MTQPNPTGPNGPSPPSIGVPSTSASGDSAHYSNGVPLSATSQSSSIPLDPPPLDPEPQPSTPATNTLALILPHRALFQPAALQLLRTAFEGYGHLAHWAPVRALGRVIIVYSTNDAAACAKREGDYLRLDVDFEPEEDKMSAGEGQEGYFGHRRTRSGTKGTVLRVYALPPTPLNAEPDFLRPPEAGRNFLISPPGSPPEGWEPIEEDGPNSMPLADDLRRALEALQLMGRGHASGPELILDEGGVRVHVEDTEQGAASEDEYGREMLQSSTPSSWSVPGQEQRGMFTPSGRIMPTSRPPV